MAFRNYPDLDARAQTKLLLTGSGTQTGDWFPIDKYAKQVVQAYSQSGTSTNKVTGTFSGTISYQITLEKDSLAIPETVFTLTSAGVRQSTTRGMFGRVVVNPWVGDDYVVLARLYDERDY